MRHRESIEHMYVVSHILVGFWIGMLVGLVLLDANNFRLLKMITYGVDPLETTMVLLLVPAGIFAIGSALTGIVIRMFAAPVSAR